MYHGVFVAVLQMLVGALCLIRVYALYGRSRRVLGLLLLVGLGFFIAALVIVAAPRSEGNTVLVVSSLHQCISLSPPLEGLYDSLAWIGVLIFDSVIFSLTLYKALTIGRGIPLLDVIVRDGAMYFSVLFIVNLVNILVVRFSPPSLKHSTGPLTNVLSTTLASRLVLNLREQNSALAGLSTTVEAERKVPGSSAGCNTNDIPSDRHLCPSREVNVGNSPEQCRRRVLLNFVTQL